MFGSLHIALKKNMPLATIPNQSSGGDGPHQMDSSRSQHCQYDVVLWTPLPYPHSAPGGLPSEPTAYIGFLPQPNGFFSEKSSNDVPPSPSAGFRKDLLQSLMI